MLGANSRPARLASLVYFAALVALAAPAALGQAQIPATTLDGTLTMVAGGTLGITTPAAGLKTVIVKDDALVFVRVKATTADIRVGDALGVAATQGSGGQLTATAINIFAPEMYGRVRKGQFPMQSGQIMTNALVGKYVPDSGGHSLVMPYEGGSATIEVPDGAQVHRMTAIKQSELKVGMHVVVRGDSNASGGVEASFITVETD